MWSEIYIRKPTEVPLRDKVDKVDVKQDIYSLAVVEIEPRASHGQAP